MGQKVTPLLHPCPRRAGHYWVAPSGASWARASGQTSRVVFRPLPLSSDFSYHVSFIFCYWGNGLGLLGPLLLYSLTHKHTHSLTHESSSEGDGHIPARPLIAMGDPPATTRPRMVLHMQHWVRMLWTVVSKCHPFLRRQNTKLEAREKEGEGKTWAFQ